MRVISSGSNCPPAHHHPQLQPSRCVVAPPYIVHSPYVTLQCIRYSVRCGPDEHWSDSQGPLLTVLLYHFQVASVFNYDLQEHWHPLKSASSADAVLMPTEDRRNVGMARLLVSYGTS